MGRDFLVPVDDSEGSAHAVEWTAENLARKGDVIHLFHVVPNVAGASDGTPGDPGLAALADVPVAVTRTDLAQDAANVKEAQSFIHKNLVPKITGGVESKIEICHFGTDTDAVGEVISKRAKMLSACAVVLSRHEKSAIAEFFMGSVTKYLVAKCEAPVVVLH